MAGEHTKQRPASASSQCAQADLVCCSH